MTATILRTEAFQRDPRMLRTALGPAIADLLADASVVEVILDPDDCFWFDRLCSGLTGARAAVPHASLVASRTEEGVASLSKLVRSALRLRPGRVKRLKKETPPNAQLKQPISASASDFTVSEPAYDG